MLFSFDPLVVLIQYHFGNWCYEGKVESESFLHEQLGCVPIHWTHRKKKDVRVLLVKQMECRLYGQIIWGHHSVSFSCQCIWLSSCLWLCFHLRWLHAAAAETFWKNCQMVIFSPLNHFTMRSSSPLGYIFPCSNVGHSQLQRDWQLIQTAVLGPWVFISSIPHWKADRQCYSNKQQQEPVANVSEWHRKYKVSKVCVKRWAKSFGVRRHWRTMIKPTWDQVGERDKMLAFTQLTFSLQLTHRACFCNVGASIDVRQLTVLTTVLPHHWHIN